MSVKQLASQQCISEISTVKCTLFCVYIIYLHFNKWIWFWLLFFFYSCNSNLGASLVYFPSNYNFVLAFSSAFIYVSALFTFLLHLRFCFVYISAFKFIYVFCLNLCDASSIGACRPRIFFINGFLCFLKDKWQRNGEGRERGDATSRRRWV